MNTLPLRKTALSVGIAALTSLTLGAFSLPVSAQTTSTEQQWVPGRLLVQPRAGLSDAEFEKIIKPHGARQVGKIEGINVRIIQLPPQASEKAVEALLKHNKHLEFVERDMLLKPDLVADDPYFGSAWHLPKIGAPTAWDVTQGQNVTIAILDSGVDGQHADLAPKLVSGWNFYDGNSDTADVYGHGTQVAGAAAAASNNSIGVSAVAGAARIMPIRVTDTSGQGLLSHMASGITWAADRGAKVANLSFAGAGGYATVQTAAQYMKSKGGLVVTAAGNYGTEQTFAASDTTIVVSATTSNDDRASWSSYGAFVDVAAPGTSIWTTTRGGGYTAASGTSVASPVAAGVVGLMMAANSNLSASSVEKLLFSTATDLGTAGFDTSYGNGRVNAAAAVQAAVGAVAADTTAPTVSLTNPVNGSTVKGIIVVDVAASDNVGVNRVELMVNGTKIATDTGVPYGFSWDSSAVPDGTATLVAYAYDAAGNYATKSISVKVENATSSSGTGSDTAAPQVGIGGLSDGSQVNGRVTVQATATDNVAVTKTRLYIDGGLVATSNGGSVTYKWNARSATTGTHTITAEADDAAGNKGSTSVRVVR
ncbi:S8 family serine peptidase [Azoarcus sp. DD4]|uniref:S8 family serine peptidase n=1 Tax=Azoarcus sp. DD4 TaxID=2027405 RepID=UPI001F0CDFE8|nr:S8 family serine peptidase [Azoarcus sp. DD4]